MALMEYNSVILLTGKMGSIMYDVYTPVSPDFVTFLKLWGKFLTSNLRMVQYWMWWDSINTNTRIWFVLIKLSLIRFVVLVVNCLLFLCKERTHWLDCYIYLNFIWEVRIIEISYAPFKTFNFVSWMTPVSARKWLSKSLEIKVNDGRLWTRLFKS